MVLDRFLTIRAVRTLAPLIVAAGLVTCADTAAGPFGRSAIRAEFALAPSYAPSAHRALAVLASVGMPLDRARVTVTRPATNAVLKDTTVMIHSGDPGLELDLSVIALPDEQLDVDLQFKSGEGTILFEGKSVVTARPLDTPSGTGTATVVNVVYVGPGAKAARITVSPANGTLPTVTTTQFSAQVFDTAGAVLSNTPLIWSASDTTLGKIDSVSGLFTPSGKRGALTISAATPLNVTGSAAINLVPQAAKIVVVSGDKQTGAVTTPLTVPLVVSVVATDNLGLANQTVTFAATDGGTITPASVTTDANGLAQVTLKLAGRIGVYNFTAASGAFSVAATATSTLGPPAQLSAVGPVAFTITSGQPPTNASKVLVADAGGNPVAGVAVTAAVTTAAGTQTVTQTVTLTSDASGLVALPPSVGLSGLAGTTTVKLSNAALTGSPITFTITVVAGAARTIAINAGNGQTATPGTAVAIKPSVIVKDTNGNVVSGVAVTFAVASGGGSITGATATTGTNGIATVGSWTLGTANGDNTLTATAAGLVGSPLTFTSIVPSTATILWTNTAGGGWSTASNWNLGRVPTATDSVVISASGTYSVTLDTTFTGPYISVGGSSGTQTLTIAGRTLTVNGALVIGAHGTFSPTNSTVAGAGSMLNQGTVTMQGSSVIFNALTNQGTVIGSDVGVIAGPFTTTASSVLRIGQLTGSTPQASLSFASGFTNNGAIELTELTNVGTYSSLLSVPSGTLVNAAGATITTLGGVMPGGSRILAATIDNRGTITASAGEPLTIASAGAHTNSGTIDLSAAGLSLSQTGSFTNTGTVTIGFGQAFVIAGGAVNQNGGTFGGAGSVSLYSLTAVFSAAVTPAALALTGSTATLATAITAAAINLSSSSTLTISTTLSTATTALTAANSTINGTGNITNASGQTLALYGSMIMVPLLNQGILTASGTSAIGGALTAAPGSKITVAQADGTDSAATLTVASSFTNHGTIELSETYPGYAYSSGLTISSGGTLTNASDGTISSLDGAVAGGSRTISAPVNNLGVINVNPVNPGTPGIGTAGTLTIAGGLVTSGTINMKIGGYTSGTYDQIVVTSGNVILGGTFTQTLINSFTPSSSTSFPMITATSGSLSGTFTSTSLQGTESAQYNPPGFPGSFVLMHSGSP